MTHHGCGSAIPLAASAHRAINPDNIYRGAVIDGSGHYEVLGKFDQARRPAQFILEADQADMANPGGMFQHKKTDVVSAA